MDESADGAGWIHLHGGRDRADFSISVECVDMLAISSEIVIGYIDTSLFLFALAVIRVAVWRKQRRLNASSKK